MNDMGFQDKVDLVLGVLQDWDLPGNAVNFWSSQRHKET
jgi:hypothetical protein